MPTARPSWAQHSVAALRGQDLVTPPPSGRWELCLGDPMEVTSLKTQVQGAWETEGGESAMPGAGCGQ